MKIPFSRPDIQESDIKAMNTVLRSGWLTSGIETALFEKEFAKYIGQDKAIFTNSCTSALKMSFKWLFMLGFDGISYPSNTFCATYSSAIETGLDAYPDICQNMGVKYKQCPKLLLFVNGVEKSIGTGHLISLDSVQKDVLMNGKRIRGSLQEPSSPKVISRPTVSRRYEQVILMKNGIILPIHGLEEIGGQQLSVKNVELHLKTTQRISGILRGLTETSNTREKENPGSSYVVNATSSMILAKVNVHFGGIFDETPCLIEDSAHRIEPNDPLVGKIRCYSFYVTKNMTTVRGGMFVTNDQEIYQKARLWWQDGLTTTTTDRLAGPVDYDVKAMAGGYDADDVYAALGRSQLRRLPDYARRRNEIRERYNAAFGGEWAGTHLFCVDLHSPERVGECREYLWSRGIGSGYHYPGTGWTSISLPIYPLLTNEQVDEVIMTMKEGGYA